MECLGLWPQPIVNLRIEGAYTSVRVLVSYDLTIENLWLDIFSNDVGVFLSQLLILSDSTGCFTCRLRRKKCDEGHPSCSACTNLCLKCEYKRPSWWGSTEQRRNQKERIKIKIKNTKSMERRGSRQGMKIHRRKPNALLTFHAIRTYGTSSRRTCRCKFAPHWRI